jgi:hypothetical protein
MAGPPVEQRFNILLGNHFSRLFGVSFYDQICTA